jgi:hypothetical protein
METKLEVFETSGATALWENYSCKYELSILQGGLRNP